jgi:hypothetical protein
MFAAHRDGDGFLLAHQNHKALTAGDGVVLGHDRDHHGGVFRALALMDGCCVGRHQGVELAKAAGDRTPIETGGEFAFVRLNTMSPLWTTLS